MNGVIDGFPEMATPIGLKDVIAKPQLKGLWTWTRGGGWWGPYLHGREQWVDLHAQVLTRWWVAGGKKTEAQAFGEACSVVLPGCTQESGCCAALRNMSLSAAQAVLLGQWGTVRGGTGDSFMRDDRMAGVAHWLQGCGTVDVMQQAVAEKAEAAAIFQSIKATWQSAIQPHLTDDVLADVVD